MVAFTACESDAESAIVQAGLRPYNLDACMQRNLNLVKLPKSGSLDSARATPCGMRGNCGVAPHIASPAIIRCFHVVWEDGSMSQTEAARPPRVVHKNCHSRELSPQTLYDKCVALARNLWWSWHPEVINLFRDLDPIRWRQLDHNPIALLARVHARAAGRAGRRDGALQPHQLRPSPAEGIPGQHADVGAPRTPACWARKPVAYFSAEFGMHESVPIYSGGLGVLSGDHIKSASGLGVPLVAIGLFYDQGYFKQHLDDDGYQQRRISRHQGRKPADGAGPRRRRQADHGPRSTPAPGRCSPRSG